MDFSGFISNFASTAKGCVKIALQSRPVTVRAVPHDRPLVILANGPSLNDTLRDDMPALRACSLMAVNFFAISDVFGQLKPQYYILADPFFFREPHGADNRLSDLHRALGAVCWPMTLFVPRTALHSLPEAVRGNGNITVQTFNAVGVEGFAWFERCAYTHRLAMPRPRNVLIAALMAAVWMGFGRIYIVGADHSWMQTIYVDDRNHVVSVQPHFYKDDERERQRVYNEYAGYHLHDIVYSFFVAFRSYHRIADFARAKGISIINSTPSSYIDAFTRAPLPTSSDANT